MACRAWPGSGYAAPRCGPGAGVHHPPGAGEVGDQVQDPCRMLCPPVVPIRPPGGRAGRRIAPVDTCSVRRGFAFALAGAPHWHSTTAVRRPQGVARRHTRQRAGMHRTGRVARNSPAAAHARLRRVARNSTAAAHARPWRGGAQRGASMALPPITETAVLGRWLAILSLAAFAAAPALAQIRIGLMVSATGPTSAIGIPQKNTGDSCRDASATRRSSTSRSRTAATRRAPCRTSRS